MLLSTSFADSTLLSNQLFWDTSAAYDYALRIKTHPEVPLLPSGGFGPYYSSLQKYAKELRNERSDAVLLARKVQTESLKMNRFLPRVVNVVLGIFGMGYKRDLKDLTDLDFKIRELHQKIMTFDMSAVFSQADSGENLEAFSGRVVASGWTYTTLKLESLDMKPVSDFSPFLMISLNEPGCEVSTAEGGEKVPMYIKNRYFSSVTSLCRFGEFYTEEQINKLSTFWETDYSLAVKRLDFLSGLSSFMKVAKTETAKKVLETTKNFEAAKKTFNDINAIRQLLENSSVRLALSHLSSESRLVASDSPDIFFDTSSYDLAQLTFSDMLSKKRLGDKYLLAVRLDSLIHGANSELSLAVNDMKSTITLMENLCLDYGGSCSYGGELPERLELTALKFLEYRLKYLDSIGRENEAYDIQEELDTKKLEGLKKLISRIEPYSEPKLIVNYYDKVLTFGQEIKASRERSDLEDVVARIDAFSNSIKSAFFSAHVKDARTIKAELLTLSKDLNITIKDLPLSIQSDIVENIIYYLSRSSLLSEMKTKYSELLKDFSSNVPSDLQCIPEVPPLGSEFEVECRIMVNNTWGVELKTANSIISFPYEPLSLSSKNFVGDTQILKSVSFSGGPVRLNFEDLGSLAVFDVKYSAKTYDLKSTCGYSYSGLSATYSCSFFSECDLRGVVTMIHPFSGRQMNSSTPYLFDGKNIKFEIPCNSVFETEFKGPSVELTGDDKVTIKSLINDTQENTINIPLEHPRGYNASISFILGPGEEKTFNLNTINIPLKNDSKNILENASLAKLPLIKAPPAFEFGCIEKNILNKVLSKYKFDRPKCIVSDELKNASELFYSGKVEEATSLVRAFIPSPQLETYLAKSSEYQERASYLLKQLDTLNPITGKLFSKYVQMANSSYSANDYLTSAIYSQYALMKSTVNLKVDYRLILALVILGYGLYSSRKKKEKEELI